MQIAEELLDCPSPKLTAVGTRSNKTSLLAGFIAVIMLDLPKQLNNWI